MQKIGSKVGEFDMRDILVAPLCYFFALALQE